MSRLSFIVLRTLAAACVLAAGLSACDGSPTQPAPQTLLAVTASGGHELGIVHLDGSGYTRLVGPELCAATIEPCSDPAWTPDGKAILFTTSLHDAQGLHSHVFVVDLSGNVRRLVPAGGVLREELWGRASPDGQWVYVTARTADEGFGVWRVALDGSSPTRVGPAPVPYGLGADRVYGVSPDGGRVLVESVRSGTQALATLDLSTGALAEISTSGLNAAWSPVDDRIAVIGWERTRLLIESPSGTPIREIVVPSATSDSFGAALSWSADGDFLLVNLHGAWYRLDPDTGTRTPLSPGPGAYGEVALSP